MNPLAVARARGELAGDVGDWMLYGRRGASRAPLGPPALSGTVYFDPQGSIVSRASDTAPPKVVPTGFSVQGPVYSSFGGIVATLGTLSPLYRGIGNGISVIQLSPQNANTDEIFFFPLLAEGAQASLIGNLTVIAAAFVGGTVTPKNRATPQLLKVGGMPGSAAAKMLLFNQTRGSYAFIDSVSAGVATMSQPLTAASFTTIGLGTAVEDDTWATGDTFILYQCPLCNLKQWQPSGSDVGVGGASSNASVAWLQWLNVYDSSTTGASLYNLINECATTGFAGCQISTRLYFSAIGRGSTSVIIGCDVTGIVQNFMGETNIAAGILRGGYTNFSAHTALADDLIVHAPGIGADTGTISLNNVYCDSVVSAQNGEVKLSNAPGLWGTASVNAFPQGCFVNVSGGTFAQAFINTGSFTFDTQNTGTKYVGGTYTDGVALTPANMDAFGGLQNPLTGARFCNLH